LHVLASLAPRYGGPTKVKELCSALGALGHEVELLTTDVDGPHRLDVPLEAPVRIDGCTITYYAVRRPTGYVFSPCLMRALFRRVREFDVVHVHGLYLFSSLATTLACRRAGVPYIVQPHGSLDDYHRGHHAWRKRLYTALIERRSIAGAAGMRFDSPSECRQALDAGIRARPFVIPPGFDSPLDAVTRQDTVPGLVTFLGRFTAKKGVDLLIEAFADVAQARPDARLQLIGPDDEGLAAAAAELASRLGIGELVSFSGLATNDEKFALLKRSCVVAVPSITESFGAVPVEAMSCGVPVVVTEGVAIAGEVARHDAGIVVERTRPALAAAILALLNDPEACRRMAANGRTLAATYAWPSIAAEVAEMYRDVVAMPTAMEARRG
jgi:glycosyltransferase involved in cell wall biosynthesis